MSRALRIEFPGAYYHITSRGNARSDIYLNDEARRYFLNLLHQVCECFRWFCHAYRSGHFTLKELGEYFECSKSTISRVINDEAN